MELRHLRYFVAVAEALNFSRAAEKLHIAQPPLSQQIQNLEGELGVALFERTGRRIKLTHAGAMFLEEARALLAQSSRAALTAQRASRGEAGLLDVGFLTSATSARFAGIIRAFRETHPRVELGLHDLCETQMLRDLRAGRIHLGFLRNLPEDEELVVEPVWEDTLNVALPEHHPLTAKARVPLAALAGEPFVMLDDDKFPIGNGCLRVLCQSAGFRPRVVQYANDLQSLVWLTAVGVGVAFVTSGLEDFQRAGMVYRPLSAQVKKARMLMAWRRDNSSPVLGEFQQVVRRVCQGRSTKPQNPRAK
jgi:DNA-binding transcriptional LysR family regulator